MGIFTVSSPLKVNVKNSLGHKFYVDAFSKVREVNLRFICVSQDSQLQPQDKYISPCRKQDFTRASIFNISS